MLVQLKHQFLAFQLYQEQINQRHRYDCMIELIDPNQPIVIPNNYNG